MPRPSPTWRRGVGLTTTSITYYYRKKEDLAAACVMRAIETMDEMVSVADGEATPAARLSHFLGLYFAQQADVATGLRPAMINFWDLRAMTGAGAETAGEAFSALFRRFRRWFADPAGPTLTREEQNARAHLVFSAFLWAKEWVSRFEPDDYPRAAARLADVLVNGLANQQADWSRTWPILEVSSRSPPKSRAMPSCARRRNW